MRRQRYGLVLVIAVALVTAPLVPSVTATQTEDLAQGESSITAAPFESTETTSRTALATKQSTSAQSANESDSTVSESAPPDPDSDVMGWEDGRWHNESISVTPEDGLNETELEAVVNRGAARVEYVRDLEFEEVPPVEVIPRSEFANNTGDRYANISQAFKFDHNIKYEALFMVGEDTDSLGVQESNQAGGVGGFYSPTSGQIKIISNNVSTPKMNEITLAQELFHALQDQHFNLSKFDQSTQELHNAKDAVIEGDGNYVDTLYQNECTDGIWNGTCLMPGDRNSSGEFDPHLGLYQISFQPYSTGPSFVKRIHKSDGWEGVNDLYDNPPASTEQVIHPEKYGEDEPTNVTIEDTSQDPWRRVTFPETNETAYAQFGEAGLFTALWYPGYETENQVTIIPYTSHFNLTANREISEVEPYLYSHPATAGWDGDKLVPYITNQSAETNETGYVYKLVWDSETDAAEFKQKWLELMEFRGAEAVDDYQDTYRIPDDEPYGDAFYLTQEGDTVLIVNGPTISNLSQIYEGAAPVAENDSDDSDSDESDGSDSDDDDNSDSDESDGSDSDDDDNSDSNEGDGSDSDDGDDSGSNDDDSDSSDGTDDSSSDDSDGDSSGSDDSNSGDAEQETTDDSSDGGGPGFTLVVAVLALIVGSLAAATRREE